MCFILVASLLDFIYELAQSLLSILRCNIAVILRWVVALEAVFSLFILYCILAHGGVHVSEAGVCWVVCTRERARNIPSLLLVLRLASDHLQSLLEVQHACLRFLLLIAYASGANSRVRFTTDKVV